jgi:hypothetical protein
VAASTRLPRNVVLIDQTSFAKFLMVGKDAEAACRDLLQRRGGETGAPGLYQMLNERRHRMRPRGLAAG